MGQQARDASIRALLVDMAWKWIDLAEFDEWDNWERTLRLRAIQAKLGKALRARCEAAGGATARDSHALDAN